MMAPLDPVAKVAMASVVAATVDTRAATAAVAHAVAMLLALKGSEAVAAQLVSVAAMEVGYRLSELSSRQSSSTVLGLSVGW